MWSEINKDVFIHHICPYLDGRDGLHLSTVCERWKELIEQCPLLMLKIKCNYIRIWDADNLPKTLCDNKLKVISQTKMSNVLENILWYKYGFNPYLINVKDGSYYYITLNTKKITKIDDFVYPLGYRGEGGTYFLDEKTGDILLVNDFYGYFFDQRCYDQKTEVDLIDHIYQHVGIMVDNFIEFQSFFPGLFSWKLIRFPFIENFNDFKKVDKTTFHRGYSICVTFHAQGVCAKQNIRKYLSKWKMPSTVLRKCGLKRKKCKNDMTGYLTGGCAMPRPPLKEFEVEDFLTEKKKQKKQKKY